MLLLVGLFFTNVILETQYKKHLGKQESSAGTTQNQQKISLRRFLVTEILKWVTLFFVLFFKKMIMSSFGILHS